MNKNMCYLVVHNISILWFRWIYSIVTQQLSLYSIACYNIGKILKIREEKVLVTAFVNTFPRFCCFCYINYKRLQKSLQIVSQNGKFMLININIGVTWKIPSREELCSFREGKHTHTRWSLFSVLYDFITDNTKQLLAQCKINYVVNRFCCYFITSVSTL